MFYQLVIKEQTRKKPALLEYDQVKHTRVVLTGVDVIYRVKKSSQVKVYSKLAFYEKDVLKDLL